MTTNNSRYTPLEQRMRSEIMYLYYFIKETGNSTLTPHMTFVKEFYTTQKSVEAFDRLVLQAELEFYRRKNRENENEPPRKQQSATAAAA